MRFLLIMALLSFLVFDSMAQSRYLKKVDKFMLLGDSVKAVNHLNKMIGKHPSAADLYLRRAQMKMDRGDLNPAMVDLNSFCSLNQTCGEAAFLKGIIRYRQDDFHGAVEYFSDYSRKHDDVNAWMYLGLTHLNLKNYQIAENAFTKVLDIDSKNYLALYNAGLAAYNYSEFDKASEYFTLATTRLPGDIDSWLGLGLAQSAQGDFTDSNKSLRQALGVQPDNGSVLYNIGVNYHGLGDSEQACNYWERAQKVKNLAAELAIEQYCSETADKGH
jgi:tetratricopeptide (TPR) repeat protein